jgi:hypothetical protein
MLNVGRNFFWSRQQLTAFMSLILKLVMKYTISFSKIVLVILIISLSSSCHKSTVLELTNACDTSNTIFNQLCNNLITNPNNINDTAIDLNVHSYTFQVTSPQTICKIGYQNLSPTNTQPYLIEIYDSVTNTLLYSGNHIFSATNTSYLSTNPIILNVGNSYTIRRTQTVTTSVSDLIGRVIINFNQQIGFPITFGNLKITSSSFSSPSSSPDGVIPYIDIVFE